MRLSVVNNSPVVCPQCGERWGEERAREFCRRCGSPALFAGVDPLGTSVLRSSIRVNAQAKLVVKAGVFGIGLMSFFCGLLLCYGGWVDPQTMDIIQVWIARVSGPVLVIQGLFYARVPFRRGPVYARPAQVLSFPDRKSLRLNR